MMIKCDDIVRERDIASVCAIFVETGLFCACLAGRLDKYDALSVFFWSALTVFRGGLAVSIVSGAGFGFCVYEVPQVRTGMGTVRYQ